MRYTARHARSTVDFATGKQLEREKETLTLDIPPDFDRETGGVFVDADNGWYRAKGISAAPSSRDATAS
jgi:hypothetical protein